MDLQPRVFRVNSWGINHRDVIISVRGNIITQCRGQLMYTSETCLN